MLLSCAQHNKKALLLLNFPHGPLALLLAGCASTQVQRGDSFVINSDFDTVWAAALASITEMGFTVRNTEKESGLIYAQGGRNVLIQNESPQLNVSIAGGRSGASTTVSVSAVQAGQLVDYGASTRNVAKFKEILESKF